MTTPGNSQSPIDFCKREITFVNQLPEIQFSYPKRTDVTLENTGSPDEFRTVRADVGRGAAFVTLSGARYDLLQFHWHTPSEHEIEGERTRLETHFVHRQVDDNSLLVIGVLVKTGEENRAIRPIFHNLPKQSGETRDVPEVHLPGLLPRVRETFRYSGSLTTPQFDEGVQFIVFTEPISFAPQQIGAFQKLFPHGNSREVQPLNGREVLCDACGM